MGALSEDAEDADDRVPDSQASTSDSDDDFLRAVARAPSLSPQPPPVAETPLTRLAHFRLDGPLGQGGMGIVYRAHDEKLDREVALKVLPGNFADDPPRQRRFLREAKLAASITHSNVATVHEIGEADGRIYIAMELVSGTTLRHHLDEGPLATAEAVRIAKEIARGVARAHARGIAHRDLKPDNVMVALDGSVKVLDFGLAKPTEVSRAPGESGTEKAASLTQLTQEGRIIGTPGYMSPEQATGRPLDVRTDVFSMGVVLYEMLSRKRPFVGETPMDIVIATSRDQAPPLSGVSTELATIVARCLEKEPSARYANAEEVLRALENAKLEVGTKTRSPKSAMLLVGVVVLLGGGAAFATKRSAAIAADVKALPAAPATAAPAAATAPVATTSTTTTTTTTTPTTTTGSAAMPSPPLPAVVATTSAAPNPLPSGKGARPNVVKAAPSAVVTIDAGAPTRGAGVISTSPY